ncbi:hypothetical protein KL953_08625 [Mycolicibacterium goodii]|nr:hypothetical protein [Mycolicibacterium goodii]
MHLQELRQTIIESDTSDWHRILRQGATYRDRFSSWSSPSDGTSGVHTDSHSNVVVYKPDIDLTIAYGMGESTHHGVKLSFEWSDAFPDSNIREISIADVFWRSSLVDRVNFVYVDGGRGILPLGEGHQGLQITQYDYAIASLLDALDGGYRFEQYYKSVPFEIAEA